MTPEQASQNRGMHRGCTADPAPDPAPLPPRVADILERAIALQMRACRAKSVVTCVDLFAERDDLVRRLAGEFQIDFRDALAGVKRAAAEREAAGMVPDHEVERAPGGAVPGLARARPDSSLPPLVLGGQGRTGDDLVRTADGWVGAFGWVVISVAVMVVLWWLVAGLAGGAR